jgi:SAM-dependent methyltransferase
LPAAAQAVLGDIRDTEKLKTYFNAANVSNETFLDAQSFAGINDNSQDFVISAHVIEHLLDPIGSIENGLRVIRPDGHYIIAVPDKRYTFDQLRPVTSLDHLLSDWRDGGLGTKLQAYREHLQYVELYFGHPVEVEPQFTSRAIKAAADGVDIHFHAWTFDSFQEMLMAVRDPLGFDIAAAVAEVVNESIFVLKKRGPGATSERALPGATSGALVRSPTLPGWVRRAWSR